MRAGGFEEGKACLRAKIDMASPFIVMRDPVLYRIKFAEHHQTGNKWCIYPMYDFTHCISDALEGITHSLCTLEFQDNRRLYDWVLDNITIPVHPRQYEFSRLNLEYTVMSKRKLNLLVTDKHVEGWDDPRMPTISGLRRRGYTAASIREFCKRIGVTKQDNTIEMASLESCIREDLNENAPARNGGYRSGETGYRKLPGRRRNGHHAEPSKTNRKWVAVRCRLAVRFGSTAPISAKKLTSSTNVWCWVKKCVCVMLRH
ncbi:glutaminyl-tRNA synthetase [Escherichia coli]|uniref:Glutaminyl-tRNA synthetase n=1 Tax=Escherichia coli TaxID=562 RepID=A0A2X1LC01_ECOLX|nr:glutaminyl-tRNA synthetase [Escherichia coli]